LISVLTEITIAPIVTHMSKKHFEALAKMVREIRADYGEQIPAESLVAALAEVGAEHNPNFNAPRFYDACKPSEAEIEASAERRAQEAIADGERRYRDSVLAE
jgi:hypothetical protein